MGGEPIASQHPSLPARPNTPWLHPKKTLWNSARNAHKCGRQGAKCQGQANHAKSSKSHLRGKYLVLRPSARCKHTLRDMQQIVVMKDVFVWGYLNSMGGLVTWIG